MRSLVNTKVFKLFISKFLKSNYLFLALLPPLFVIKSIYVNTVDIYFWDSWGLVPNLLQSIDFKWLFTLHNEHWIVFTKLTYYIQFEFFQGSKALILTLQVMIQLYLLYYFKNLLFKLTEDKLTVFILLMTFSVLLFPKQMAGVWYWGFAIQQQLTFIFFIFALQSATYIKHGCLKWRFYLPLLFLICSVFSSALGWVSFLILFLLFLIKRELRAYCPLIICTGGILFFFYMGLKHTGVSSNEVSYINVLLYFLSYLGSIIGQDNVNNAAIIGGVSIVLLFISALIFLFQRDKSSENYILFSIISFTLISGVLAAIGRSHLGIEQSQDSRYIPLTNLYWVSLILIILSQKWRVFERNIGKLLLGGLIVLFVVSYSNTVKQADVYLAMQSDKRIQYEALKYDLYIYEPISVYTLLFPNLDTVIPLIDKIKLEGSYHLFSEQSYKNKINLLQKKLSDTQFKGGQVAGGFEKINVYDTKKYKKFNVKAAYEIQGWLDYRDVSFDFEKVFILNQLGLVVGIADTGFLRADVANYLKSTELKFGWRGIINSQLVVKGDVLTAYILEVNKMELVKVGGVKVFE